MKTSTTKNNVASNTHSTTPFFNKNGNPNFFSSFSKNKQPFFNSATIIQKQEENGDSSNQTPTQGNSSPQSFSQICDRTFSSAEESERQAIFVDLIRGLGGLDARAENVVKISMCRFSLGQLTRMKNAGLRIWRFGSFPPIFQEYNFQLSGRGSASYASHIRTIFIGSTVNSAWLTHEMAHAWDHIRTLRGRLQRLDDLNSRQRRRRIFSSRDTLRPATFLTETRRAQNVAATGATNPSTMTFTEMYNLYVARVPLRELAFGGNSRAGYSRTNVKEFYAEGYTVFHGRSIIQQGRLYRYANEFYNYLNNEAIRENMPTPDLIAVQGEAQRLPRPRRSP